MKQDEMEEIVPKTEKREEIPSEKPKKSKEELAKDYQQYYEWLDTIYPIGNFELQGREGETLYFHHGYNLYDKKDDEPVLVYHLRDTSYKEFAQQQRELLLKGEVTKDDSKTYSFKGSIVINKKEKRFSFLVEREYKGKGYGRAIYDNYLQILEMLGIEDKELYTVAISQNTNHPFLQRMYVKEVVARTSEKPNLENAQQILQELARWQGIRQIRLKEINDIIDYAIRSNVPMAEIAKSLNENGLSIGRDVFHNERKEVESLQSFGGIGLKATAMHQHFMQDKDFAFMQFITEPDVEDTTIEFRRILAEVKKEYRAKQQEDRYIEPNLQNFGELEHIILDWKNAGLLFRSVIPEIQEVVKRQAISKFEEFDPEHKQAWNWSVDDNSFKTFKMLSEAGLMDKDTYIALYQKALNRNYTLRDFDGVIFTHISREEREKARREIAENTYYPSPKKKWQKAENRWDKEHSIPRVAVPQALAKKGNVRELLKQQILQQGIARKTKIKTDMIGKGKDGKPFIVDNLKDWLFGVPGTHGNLQMIGNSAIVFPPQTPEFAVQLIEQALKSIEYPDFGERE